MGFATAISNIHSVLEYELQYAVQSQKLCKGVLWVLIIGFSEH